MKLKALKVTYHISLWVLYNGFPLWTEIKQL